MKPQQIYQAMLGMVIGLSILSYLLQLPMIAYTTLSLAFVGLISERFGEKLVSTMHAVTSFVWGWMLKVVLSLVYLLLLTPIALLRKGKKQAGGWQSKEENPLNMEYTW